MDLKKLLASGKILDDMAISIRNIIYDSFPGTTPQEREDIEQEAKLKLWRMASNGKKIANFRSYLWKVVYTTALDIIEERMHKMSDEEIQKAVDSSHPARFCEACPEFQWQHEEMKMKLNKTVALLPPRRRSVVQLWLSDMNLEEIAACLGWSANQVRHLLYRGIEELKEIMTQGAGSRFISTPGMPSAPSGPSLNEPADEEDPA
jgi:RNA polymerase sigma-70 factor (ECF subfamily)